MAIEPTDKVRIKVLWSGQQADNSQVHMDYTLISNQSVDETTALAGFGQFIYDAWFAVRDQWTASTVLEKITMSQYNTGLTGKWKEIGDLPIQLAGLNPNSESLPAQCAFYWRRKTTLLKGQKKQWLPAPAEFALQNGLFQGSAIIKATLWATTLSSQVTAGGRDWKPVIYSPTYDYFGDITGEIFIGSRAGTIRRRSIG